MGVQSPWEIDHIGIAVTDLDAAIALYSSRSGASITLRERIESQGVELAFLSTLPTKLELLMPTNPETPLGRFLSKRGPGLHHICYKVADIRRELVRLAKEGVTLIDSEPRPGAGGTRIAFLHPSSFYGVLTELCEYSGS